MFRIANWILGAMGYSGVADNLIKGCQRPQETR